MKLGQLVLFHNRQGSDPQVGIVTQVHSDDNVNLRVIPNNGEAMSFQPNVPRRIGNEHLYSFECANGPNGKKKAPKKQPEPVKEVEVAKPAKKRGRPAKKKV